MSRVVQQSCNTFDEAGARACLRARLGAVPRRLGGWTELALAGALSIEVPAGPVGLILGSALGPVNETLGVLNDVLAGAPTMPFGFMQSQPAISLSVMAAQWPQIIRTTCMLADDDFWDFAARLADHWALDGVESVLAGWVDSDAGRSDWTLFAFDAT
ncbi:hypothetical protein [Niveibacterium sp. COAC-50]|uniref:hypothetical protein n=1 Tax=Niveibacterium sp. COAC-50 TaxID=2729384 RepID=UPI001556D36B|nr:hypothetical protein [Niveibacterium sp. COAC-50]